jgi:hypothetical protein
MLLDQTHESDEGSLNRAALVRIGQAVLGYDALQAKHTALAKEVQTLRAATLAQERCIEYMSRKSGEKDERIAHLEEDNKDLSEDLTFYEDVAAARKAKRESKRQRVE